MKFNFKNNLKTENGSFLFQYLCAITASLIILTNGMHYGWPTPSLPKLLGNNSHITVTDTEGSWIAVFMLLGCPVGSILACLTVDIFGRKKILLLTAVPSIAGWIMIAFVQSAKIMYIARFIVGISDGIVFTALPMYLGEIAHPKIRGLIGSSCVLTMMIAIVLVNILGMFFDIMASALISLIPPILFVTSFIWMPESPYFLIMKGQNDLARKNLMILKGKVDVENEISALTKAVMGSNLEKTNILHLFRKKSNRRGLIIIVGLRTFQQLSGITAIIFYAQIIFESIGGSLSADVITVIYFLVQCVVTAISSMLLDKAGRRPLLLISTTGCALALILQGTYYYFSIDRDLSHLSVLPITSLILFNIFYCIGMGTIPVLMLGELFPTDVKAFALCIAEIYYGVLAAAASKFFQIIKDEFELFIPFYVFAVFCVIGFVFVIYIVPETKGKTLEEIQENLEREDDTKWKRSDIESL